MLRRGLLGRDGTIFTLHRFGSNGDRSGRLDPVLLARALGELTELGFHFVPLTEMIDQAERGDLPPRSIAWTVDDGYADFAELAMPVFERYRCPVTTFLISGFIDRKMWPWWDQVAFIFEKASLPAADASRLVARMKRLPDEQKWMQIRSIAETHKVELPDEAPSQYKPLSWDQVRDCARRGASFGPHSVNHPVLPNVSNEQAAQEIGDSWARVKHELGEAAVPILAYPNGDYGRREVNLARDGGMLAALTTRNGHISPAVVRNQPFELPRFDLRPDSTALRQIVSGMEAAKLNLRGGRASKPLLNKRAR